MKKIGILVLLVLIGLQFSLYGNKTNKKTFFNCEKMNCGKIEGYIIDPDTKERIKKPFVLMIFDEDAIIRFGMNADKMFYYTLKDGSFSILAEPGIYYIQFQNYFSSTKYTKDPHPAIAKPEELQRIIVKSGQIVKIFKKAKLGGNISIKIVDKQENQINFTELFGTNVRVNGNLKYSDSWGPKVKIDSRNNREAASFSLEEGDCLSGAILPGKYDLNVTFNPLGYGKQETVGIDIIAGVSKEIKFVVDFNDNTGIRGIVRDENGNPAKDIFVSVNKNPGESISDAGIYTDSNGYYKIIGLKEGEYYLMATVDLNSYTTEDDSFNEKLFRTSGETKIFVKEKSLLRKDLIINLSISN